MVVPSALRNETVKTLDEVDVLHVGCDERAAGLYALLPLLLFGECVRKSCAYPVGHGAGNPVGEFVYRSPLQGLVCGHDGLLDGAGRLQPSVRSSLSGAMNAHERLEEEAVSKIPGLVAHSTDFESLVERCANLLFLILGDPFQDRRSFATLKGQLRSLDNRSIKCVAMRG